MKRALSSALAHIVLIAFSAAIVLPLLWVLRVSLTDKLTAYRMPPEWTAPTPPTTSRSSPHTRSRPGSSTAWSSAIGSTLVALPLAAGLAYAFARYGTGGASLRLAVLASQMLPPVVLVLPLFAMFLTAGLLNTLGRADHGARRPQHAVPHLDADRVLPGRAAQLEEAARIEGASRFQAFCKVAVPIAAPGILAAGLLAFILSWNEFLFALILSGRATNYPAGRARHAGDPPRVEIALLAAAALVASCRHWPCCPLAPLPHQRPVARRPEVSLRRGEGGNQRCASCSC